MKQRARLATRIDSYAKQEYDGCSPMKYESMQYRRKTVFDVALRRCGAVLDEQSSDRFDLALVIDEGEDGQRIPSRTPMRILIFRRATRLFRIGARFQ